MSAPWSTKVAAALQRFGTAPATESHVGTCGGTVIDWPTEKDRKTQEVRITGVGEVHQCSSNLGAPTAEHPAGAPHAGLCRCSHGRGWTPEKARQSGL